MQLILRPTSTTWYAMIQWWNKQNDGTWTQPIVPVTPRKNVVQYLARRMCCDFIGIQRCTLTLNTTQTRATYSCKLCAQISCKVHFKEVYQSNNFVCYTCKKLYE